MNTARDWTELLEVVHAELGSVEEGEVARYIPELAEVDPHHFALAACGPDGVVHAVGDVATSFTLQSISKPFAYALALSTRGAEAVHARVGMEPTGDAFDSIIQLEDGTNRPHNPMINAGAIAVTSLIEGAVRSERLNAILRHVAACAGREAVSVDAPVFLSERACGHRNRAIAYLMRHFGMLEGDVEDTLELYFQQCAILVDVRDLAVMAQTLAGGGLCALSGRRVLAAEHVRSTLAVMASCGLYDASGEFLLRSGLFAKSGVSGGVLAVAPGGVGLAAWSPRLDERGNSVRATRAVLALADRLGRNAFAPAHAAASAAAAAPDAARIPAALERAHQDARSIPGGRLADYVPSLAAVDPERLAAVVVDGRGQEWAVGDADHRFSMQSTANPLGYLRALQTHGLEAVHTRVGMEASGNPFNAIRFDPRTRRPFNPLVNAGAIAVASMIPGADGAARLQELLGTIAAAAGEKAVHVDVPLLMEERTAADRNRAIACLLQNFGLLEDAEGALELFLAQCSITMTTRALARIAATLAFGGRNPVSGQQVFEERHVARALATMVTCGLNDASGRFAVSVGLAAKSGISGALLAVAPGRLGLAAYAPGVDAHGNSVRGVRLLERLAAELELSMFSAT